MTTNPWGNSLDSENKLSTSAQWDERWSQMAVTDIRFDPENASFRETHRLFQSTLPKRKDFRFLEVGCYPGSRIWYFNKYFGYQGHGLEYVDWCCKRAEEFLAAVDVEAELINEDFFSFTPPKEEKKWDVVGSFGFVEHFEDVEDVVRRHVELIRKGGFLVITVPNHSRINGMLFHLVNRKNFLTHNQMALDNLVQAIEALGTCRILSAAYLGRIGFWNIGLYERLYKLGRFGYSICRAPFWVVERAGRVLPNSQLFSPIIAVVAQRIH